MSGIMDLCFIQQGKTEVVTRVARCFKAIVLECTLNEKAVQVQIPKKLPFLHIYFTKTLLNWSGAKLVSLIRVEHNIEPYGTCQAMEIPTLDNQVSVDRLLTVLNVASTLSQKRAICTWLVLILKNIYRG